jgi:drug/metabolite transporter (DMT)-like permease
MEVKEGSTKSGSTVGPRSIQRSDYMMLLILGVIWGSAFPVIRVGLLAGVPPLLFAGARCALGAMGVAIIAMVAKERFPSSRAVILSAVVGGALTMGGYFAFLYIGEEAVPGGLSSIIVASNPLWSAAFALAILPKERLGRYGIAGLVLGFLGIMIIFAPGLVGQAVAPLTAMLEVLMAPFLFALGTVLLRRYATGPQGFWGISTQLGAGSVVLIVGNLALGASMSFAWATPAWYSLLYLIALPTCVGYAIYFALHHRIGPTQANLVSYVSPVAGLLVAAVILAEVPSVVSIAGLCVVILGLFLVGRDPRPTGSKVASQESN